MASSVCYVKTLTNQKGKFYAISAKGKQWRVGEVIDIAFMEGTKSQKEFVKKYASEWEQYANVKFNWDVSSRNSDVRITFRKNLGSWSYVGTDALFIPKSQATMNFGWLDESTVLHEFGHMLSLLHEHQNPKGGLQWNRDQVIKDLSGPPNNWDLNTIEHNVLNSIPDNSVNGTTFDPHSIMLYFFPDHWVKSGKGTKQNSSISQLDRDHIAKLYPFENKPKQSLLSRLKRFIFNLIF